MDNKNLNEIKEEVDFSEVVSSPTRMFGLIYLVSIVSLIIAGAFYVKNLDYISDNNPKHKLATKRDSLEDLATKPAVTLAGVDVKLAGEASDANIAKGADSFAKNCVSCHGEKGEGNGVAGAALKPAPRNFTQGEGWKNGRKLSEIYKTLEEGIAGGGMASYNHLPADERIALAHYVRMFKKDDSPKISEEELNEMDLTYSLSQGRSSKAQIPVKKATTIVMTENWNNKSVKVNAIAEKIKSSNSAEAKKYIQNLDRALSFLAENTLWRASSSDFVKVVATSAPQNGFSQELVRINKSELSSLYSYLIGLYSQN